jgi:hypothetical protein
LKNHPKPSVVVLDCAPRSFNDSGVTEPNATLVFDHCFQIQDLAELQKLYLPKFADKIDFLCSRFFFTYHHRQWLAAMLKKQGVDVLMRNTPGESRIIPKIRRSTTSTKLADTKPASFESDSVKHTDSIQPSFEETKPGKTESPDPAAMTKSIQEYRDRYQYTNRSSLACQLKFLKLISQRCANEHIRLIVVNMPLSGANRQLLSDGFYSDFTNDASAAVVGNNAIFINLATANGWPISHYSDSAHLNAKGGAKLNRLIAEAIVNLSPAGMANTCER